MKKRMIVLVLLPIISVLLGGSTNSEAWKDPYPDEPGNKPSKTVKLISIHKSGEKAVLAEVLRVLRGAYPIRHVVGHSDVTARKQDPGPELREFMCY